MKSVSGDKTTGSHIIAWAALSLRPTIKALLATDFLDHSIVINTLNKTLQLNSVQQTEFKSALESRDAEIQKFHEETVSLQRDLKGLKTWVDKANSGKKKE